MNGKWEDGGLWLVNNWDAAAPARNVPENTLPSLEEALMLRRAGFVEV
jgi:hypothetical protein